MDPNGRATAARGTGGPARAGSRVGRGSNASVFPSAPARVEAAESSSSMHTTPRGGPQSDQSMCSSCWPTASKDGVDPAVGESQWLAARHGHHVPRRDHAFHRPTATQGRLPGRAQDICHRRTRRPQPRRRHSKCTCRARRGDAHRAPGRRERCLPPDRRLGFRLAEALRFAEPRCQQGDRSRRERDNSPARRQVWGEGPGQMCLGVIHGRV